MTSRLLRILSLIALLWMPLGMSAAPAMPVVADSAMADHCSDHGQKDEQPPAKPSLHCTACAALPAVGTREPALPLVHDDLTRSFTVETIRGILPEIATPPPKAA